LETPGCKICSVPVPESVEVCASCYGKNYAFENNRAGFVYEGLVRDLIRDIKFRKKKSIAEGLGRLWATHIIEPLLDGLTLVPLPMHKAKRRQRGFDQAYVIAKAIGEAKGITVIDILERTKYTPPQSGLHPRQRIENVAGAFRIKKQFEHIVAGQSFILIDDIYTTGASLNECAKVLKSNGAVNVYTMTLAITVKSNSDDGNGT